MPPSSSKQNSPLDHSKSPVRSPRHLMRMQSIKKSPPPPSIMDEVRETLSMPGTPALSEDSTNSDGEDERNVSDHESEGSEAISIVSMNTTANTAANSVRRQQPKLTRLSSNASVGTSVSTGSTRSLGLFLRKKKKHSEQVDDVSVSSTKSKGWFNRTRNRRASGSGEMPKFKSFRWKKGKKTGRKVNDRLVADFFDVQSLASEPDYVGSNKLTDDTLKKSQSSRVLETRSVTSQRSTRSLGFAAFLFRKKQLNDEVKDLGVDNLSGNEIEADDDEMVDYDEDITLGSGFENMSLADSIDDDGSVMSRESFNSRSSTISRKRESKAPDTPKRGQTAEGPIVNKPTFLQRVLSRRRRSSDGPRKKVGRHPSATDESYGSDLHEESAENEPVTANNVERSKTLIQNNALHTSSKSLGALPTRPSSLSDDAQGQTQPEAAPERRGPDGGLCRWDSDHSIMSESMAPKQPLRRIESSESSESEENSMPIQVPTQKMPASSQSMRNLRTSNECKEDDGGDDDDSVLSLLSGLLATWSAEHDGVDRMETSASPDRQRENVNEWRPKSILKTSCEGKGAAKVAAIEESKEADAREQLSVSFDKIEIREYERTVGDNPSCSRGPPISIGWGYNLAHQYPLDDYELLIKPPKRSKKEFHLAADKRTHLLVTVWECSEDEIRKARREATYIQYCRAKTSFSGSRAAAKEAAFLRKANDRSKQIQHQQSTKKATVPPTMKTPPTKMAPTTPTRFDSDRIVSKELDIMPKRLVRQESNQTQPLLEV